MRELQNERIGGNALIELGRTAPSRCFDSTTEKGAPANHDLLSARDVQRRLLPHRSLNFADLACDTYYRPFHSIGGDYYDFVPLVGNRLGIAVGDVSGKSVGPALIMASLQASLPRVSVITRVTPLIAL